MSRALQIYYSAFDEVFLRLPGGNRYRLRVTDYRIIYTFDATRSEIHLFAVGHRREIYR